MKLYTKHGIALPKNILALKSQNFNERSNHMKNFKKLYKEHGIALPKNILELKSQIFNE